MRRSRRGGHSGHEFGGSGEDSFVAVVVTKLTGALLFILLLTMVIMALLPKAIDLPASPGREGRDPADAEAPPLAISTPGALPEAVAGRAYAVALAATGGRGPLRWSVEGDLPEGLRLDPAAGLIEGTPKRGTAEPLALTLRVEDGDGHARRPTRLAVLRPDQAGPASAWRPSLPPIAWRDWLDQGFGFLVLVLVHAVGMGVLAALERRTAAPGPEAGPPRRYAAYRFALRAATAACVLGLAAFLVRGRV